MNNKYSDTIEAVLKETKRAVFTGRFDDIKEDENNNIDIMITGIIPMQ